MKTIRQIREEYDDIFLNQVDNLPEEIMLEGVKSKSSASPVPSSKEMPMMLVFRRIQYRIFPNKQVVALYYSRMINKYLSIPYGPDGNVNLSEATIMEPEMLDEDWQKVNRRDKTDGLSQAAVNAYRRENPGSKLKTAVTEKNPKGKRAARRKSFCSRMGGMKKRLTSAKTARDPDSRINKALRRWNCEESFKQKLQEKRMQRDEGFTDAISGIGNAIGGIGSAIGRGAGAVVDAVKGAAKFAMNPLEGSKPLGQSKSARANIKKGSVKPKVTDVSPTYSSKIRQAELSRTKVQENKISDIRKALDENVKLMDLNINGKTVTLNNSMAKRIVEVYDSVNTKNKKIVEGMLNEDLESFKRLLNFSIKV